MNDILADVRETAASLFELPESEISADSSPDNIANWDSVKQLFLVLAIEQRFNVEFDPSEIEELTTIGEIAALLERKLK